MTQQVPQPEPTTQDAVALQTAMTDPAQLSTGPKPADDVPQPEKKADEPAPKPEATPEPNPKDTPEPTPEPPTEYETYADPEANAIVGTLKEAGLSPQESYAIFGKATETGNIGDIDVAKLKEKLGDTQSQLVLSAISNHFSKVTAQVTALKNAIFDVTGGEANFTKIADWAKAKEGTDAEFAAKLAVYRGMLQQGPLPATLAIKELKAAYIADPSNKSLDLKVVAGDTTATGALQPISKMEYFREMEKAILKRDTAKVAELNARRKATPSA